MRSLRALAASSVGVGSIMAAGISGSALAQDAVQWRIEDGGNGHWYALSGPNFSIWSSARQYADSLGGHLATMTSAAEQAFALTVAVSSSPDRVDDAWLGGFQDTTAPDYNEPSGGWRWVTGESWVFTAWRSDGQPAVSGSFIAVTTVPEDLLGWVSSFPTHEPGNCQAFVEWSADCNADGIVDYGQIRAGDLADTNANNIPDCCEAAAGCNPCLADIDESGVVNAVDLAAILTVWGTSGGKYPRADINNDGEVNGPDLAAVLSAWGPCP